MKRNSIWFILDISMVIFIQFLFACARHSSALRWNREGKIDHWFLFRSFIQWKKQPTRTNEICLMFEWLAAPWCFEFKLPPEQHNSIIMPQILIRTDNNNNDFEFISSDPFLNVFICMVLILSNCSLKQHSCHRANWSRVKEWVHKLERLHRIWNKPLKMNQ